MFEIMIVNPMLWVNILIPFIIGIILVVWKKEYNLKEFGIQSAITFVIMFLFFSIAFASTANLFHNVYYNTYIKAITYFEEWTERVKYTEEVCHGSGDKRTCHTVTKIRYDYHSPYYQLEDKLGGTKLVSKSDYLLAAGKYGAVFTPIVHFDQSSHGDGNSYVVTFTDIVPYVQEHSEINYLKAVKYNVLKAETFEKNIERFKKNGQLLEYPEIFESVYGSQNINRVLKGRGVTVNTNILNNKLCEYASVAGSIKQVNPLIYVVNNQSREFKEVLKAYWKNGSKNDAILVVSVDGNGTVQWSDVIAWTKNIDFNVDNSKIYKGLNINDNQFFELYKYQINKNFQRTQMKSLKYLSHNIDISLTAELVIILINILASGFAFFWFLRNDPFNKANRRY